MRIFCLDLHIGPVSDFKQILKKIRPDIELVSWNLSDHIRLLGERRSNVDIISSPGIWFQFDLEMIRKFQERYDSFLRSFDAFFVAHAFSMLMVYETYNKPVYCWNTCRYDLPFNFIYKNQNMLPSYHECIQTLHKSGRLRGFTNNLGDQEYVRLGTGITFPLLPSMCEYTGMSSNPTSSRFLWYSDQPPLKMVPNIIDVRPPNFRWSDLGAYRGIIHVPYEASTMSITEHYNAGIPVFVPSKAFLKYLWTQGAPWNSMSHYWGNSGPNCFKDCRQMDFWLDRADFYNPEWMPYVMIFESFHHLASILRGFRDEARQARLEWINTRKQRILDGWKECLA